MRILRMAVMVLALMATSIAPALADHTHVMATGNDMCVILAPHGGESHVELPHADEFPENRRHPLHVRVHLGEPGERGSEEVIWVQGSPADAANCAGYLN